MLPRKFRILSAITAGSLALTVVAITASSGASPTAKHAALAAQTESFPLVNLDECPTLHTGYPTGGCVAQLQADLNIIQGNRLAVDGTFGSVGSQTYEAVIAFQQAHDLQQDGMVGPATKQALDAALSAHTPTVPPATAPAPSPPAPSPAPSDTQSTASVTSPPVVTSGIVTSTIYFNKKQTDYFDSDESQACGLIAAYSLPIPGAGEVGELVAGACEIDVSVIELQASRAAERDMCLKIKFINPQYAQTPILWPDIYRGQYCD